MFTVTTVSTLESCAISCLSTSRNSLAPTHLSCAFHARIFLGFHLSDSTSPACNRRVYGCAMSINLVINTSFSPAFLAILNSGSAQSPSNFQRHSSRQFPLRDSFISPHHYCASIIIQSVECATPRVWNSSTTNHLTWSPMSFACQ